MDATVTPHAEHPVPVSRRALIGPLACGCVLIGAAAVVAVNDPSAPGSFFPPCPLHELTGIWCPGCGLTRATHAMLRGHPLQALSYNLLWPLFALAIVSAWSGWLRSAMGKPTSTWLTRANPWASGVVSAVVLVTFGVLRNLPPFAALAP